METLHESPKPPALQPDDSSKDHSHDSRLFGSAKIIALCTILSRITGLARDMLLNHRYGAGWVQDAFNYGFQVPNLFRRLFGEGALSAVFVPVFTDVLEDRGKTAAWILLGRVTALMALALTGLFVLLELCVLAVWLIAPGDAMRQLQLGLTAFMLPFMISVCVLALFSAILNCIHHFTVPALLPIVLNLLMILGITVVGPIFPGGNLERQIYGVAICVLVASVIQVFLIMPVLRRHGVHFRLSLTLRDPDLRRMLRTFIPIVLGQGILLVNVFLDSQICTFLTRGPGQSETLSILGITTTYPLTPGALSAVTNAQRLYQFPLGVLAISLATVALPLFSRHAARGDMPALRNSIGQAMRMAIYEGLPSGVIMIVLAAPIVSLLFEYHNFGPQQTERAAAVLRLYGIGMIAFCSQHIVLRAFYSLKDTQTPMWISCSLAAVSVLINVTLVWHPGVREKVFGLSTSITSLMHVGISMWFLRKRMGGRMGAKLIVSSLIRTTLATALAAAAAWMLLNWSNELPLDASGRIIRRCAHVFIPLTGAIAVYLAATWMMRMEEIGWLLGWRRSSEGAHAEKGK